MLTTAIAAIASLVLAPPRHLVVALHTRATTRAQARARARIEAAAAAVLATEPLRCTDGAEG